MTLIRARYAEEALRRLSARGIDATDLPTTAPGLVAIELPRRLQGQLGQARAEAEIRAVCREVTAEAEFGPLPEVSP